MKSIQRVIEIEINTIRRKAGYSLRFHRMPQIYISFRSHIESLPLWLTFQIMI